MMREIFKQVLESIKVEETKRNVLKSEDVISDACYMVTFLLEVLEVIKKDVMTNDFAEKKDEIEFFKEIKPQITGKIMYYRNLADIESFCPKENSIFQKEYYKEQETELRKNKPYKDIYKYLQSKRIDKDLIYFTRTNTSIFDFCDDFFLKTIYISPPNMTYR